MRFGFLVQAVAVGFFTSQIAAGFSFWLREVVYDKVMSFSQEEAGPFSAASLIMRSTNDITQVEMFVIMGLLHWSARQLQL